MSSFGKVVGAIALLLLAAAGLLMSLCGGVFTYASMTSREMSGVWVISVPSLAIGSLVAWVAIRIFLKRSGRPPEV
jgi:hypothetical protein